MDNIKYAIILALITTILGFFTYMLDSKFDEGFAEGQLELRQDYDASMVIANNRLKKERQAALDARNKRDALEEKLQKLLRNPPPAEVTYVEVIKTIPAECTDLGDGIKRMWNYYANMSRVISEGH